MKVLRKQQSGLTLIELMIAITIGLIVMATTIVVFVTSLRSNTDTLNMIRLNQELQAVTTLVVKDVRRSGYWGINTAGTVNIYAPVASSFNQSGGAGDDCILLAYDLASNGAGGGNDYIGYKWDTDHMEMKVDDTAFDCSGDWEDLTDPAVVNILEPVITIAPELVGLAVDVNVLNMELTGTLVEDPTVSRTIKITTRIRNDVIN